MKQINKTKKLKKGDKMKANNDEYLVDDFKEDGFYNEETGDNTRTREIMLTSPGKTLKKLKQKFAVNYNNENKSVQLIKISEKSEKFKNGFSYEKSSVIMSYSGEGSDEENIEDNEIEYEINDDHEEDSEDW